MIPRHQGASLCADGTIIDLAKGLWLFALKFGVIDPIFLSRSAGRCMCDSGAVLAARAREDRFVLVPLSTCGQTFPSHTQIRFTQEPDGFQAYSSRESQSLEVWTHGSSRLHQT